MSGRKGQDTPAKEAERRRLAEALRANLKRRKSTARRSEGDTRPPDATPTGKE